MQFASIPITVLIAVASTDIMETVLYNAYQVGYITAHSQTVMLCCIGQPTLISIS